MKRKITLLMLSILSLNLFTACSQEAGGTLNRTGTITFYDGSTKLGEITGKSGDPFSEADKAKLTGFETKTDYAFRGWYSDSEITKPENVKFYSYKDYSVYANFKPYVTITLDLNGGTLDEGVKSYIKGVSGDQITAELPKPTKENAYFDNWYYEEANPETGKIDQFTEFKFPEKNVKLVAHYDDFPVLSFILPKNKFGDIKLDPVTLDPMKIVSDQFTFSEAIKNIINPSATASYKFDGWYILKDLKEGMTEEDRYKDCNQFFFNQKLDKNTTIFPKFSDKVTVTFKVDGETETIFAPVTKFSDEKLTAPIVTEAIDKKLKELKPDSYFTGWATKDSEGKLTPYSFINMPSEDLTLYATFTLNPVFKLYKDETKTGPVLFTLNTYSPDQKIVIDDLKNLESKLDLPANKKVSHWIIEKTDQSDVVTKTQIVKETIEGKEKSVYLVLPKDSKLKSIAIYPVVEETHTLKIYEATYKLDTGIGRYVPSKTTALLGSTTGVNTFYEPTITLENDSKIKSQYFREVEGKLELTSFPLSTENGDLKEIYLLLAKKVSMEVGDIYVNNKKITTSKVGKIVLGYQNLVSSNKLIDIDKTTGKLVINGDTTKVVQSDLLKSLVLADIQFSTVEGGKESLIKDLVFDNSYKLRVPFVDLGTTSNPVNIRLIQNF